MRALGDRFCWSWSARASPVLLDPARERDVALVLLRIRAEQLAHLLQVLVDPLRLLEPAFDRRGDEVPLDKLLSPREDLPYAPRCVLQQILGERAPMQDALPHAS